MKKSNIAEIYKGLSFSEASKKIEKKYKNASTDLIEKASMENELMQLVQHQEKVKTIDSMTNAIKQFKKGGMLPKYNNGTPLNGIPEENGVPLADPLFGGNFLAPSPIVDPMYGIRPETILGYSKTSMTPGVAVRPFDDTAFGTTREASSMFGNAPTINNNLGMSTPKDAPVKPREMSAYMPALIGQGISTAINAGILAGGYDKVAPVDNPYESQVINNMASRGIDTTQQRNQILSAYNAARENLSGTRSINVRNALDTNLMNTTQDNLAESNLNQQNLNNGYKGDLAQTLNNLGQQKAQAQTYAEQLNNQSKSNWQGGISELGKHLADIGLSQTTLKLNNVQQTAIANIMSQKYPNFMIGEEALKNYLNGTYTDEEFVKLKQAASKNPELQSVLDFATFQKQRKENKG